MSAHFYYFPLLAFFCAGQTRAGLIFGESGCVVSAFSVELQHGGYRNRMGLYRAKVEQYVASIPVTDTILGNGTVRDVRYPKSREEFLSEAKIARLRDPKLFSEVSVFERVSRIDSRGVQEIAALGGIFGGSPLKPKGTLLEHTTQNFLGSSHGTSSYTSVSKGGSESNLKNEFLLGIRPSRLILASGEHIALDQPNSYLEVNEIESKDKTSKYEGAVAVWESYLYHGENVEGVAITGGFNAAENEVILRGFVPVGVQRIAVFQPLVRNTQEGGMHRPKLPHERLGLRFSAVTDVVLGKYQTFIWKRD